jgi:hypothetical protein
METWQGFKLVNGKKVPMQMLLNITNETITGEGADQLGSFIIQGTCKNTGANSLL